MKSQRWKPVRLGLLNVYEYGNQIFEMQDGRLLLRGINGSGKSKALELTLPFLLEGDISPSRMSTFGHSRGMYHSVLGCKPDGTTNDTAYVWVEFQRQNAIGACESLTAGIGMSASTHKKDRVERWYWLLDQRVGHDFELLGDEQRPLSREQLVALVRERGGQVFAKQSEYQDALNRAVFGFEDMDTYKTMINLMLKMRAPHLSQNLDIQMVREFLLAALPSIDPSKMEQLRQGLDSLDRYSERLRSTEEAEQSVRKFSDEVYAQYACSRVHDRASALIACAKQLDAAEQASTAAEQTYQQASAELEALRRRSGATAEQLTSKRGQHQALRDSDAYKSVQSLEALQRLADQARGRADGARRARDEVAADLAQAGQQLQEAERQLQQAEQRQTQCQQQAEQQAIACGLQRPQQISAGGEMSVQAWLQLVGAEATERREAAERQRALIDQLEAAQRELAACRRSRDEAQVQLDHEQERRAEAEAQLEAATETLAQQLEEWAAELQQLQLTGAEAEQILAELLDPATGVAPTLATTLAAQRDQHIHAQGELRQRAEQTQEQAKQLQAQHDLLAAEVCPQPEAADGRSSRAQLAGAPLWQLVEFAEGLSLAEQAAVEAALELSGLLDAWITPEGSALDETRRDLALLAGPPLEGQTLCEVLVADSQQSAVPAEIITAVLARVGLDHPQAAVSVRRDGQLTLGPAQGRGGKERAQFIGAEARERARKAKLAELQQQIDELTGQAAELARQAAEREERAGALQREADLLPSTAALRSARNSLQGVLTSHARAESLLAEREREVEAALEPREQAQVALTAAASRERLPDSRAALDELARQLTQLTQQLRELRAAADDLQQAELRAESARQRQQQLSERERERQADAERDEREALQAEATIDQARAALGQDPRAILEEASRLSEAITTLEAQLARLQQEQEQLIAHSARTEAAWQSQREAQRDATSARDAALTLLRRPKIAPALRLAVADQDLGRLDEISSWSDDETLKIARRVSAPQVRRDVDDLYRRRQDISARLGDSAIELDFERDQPGEEGILLPIVRYENQSRELSELLQYLSEQSQRWQQMLDDETRQMFSTHMMVQLADHLRDRITLADTRLREINGFLADCEMNSGMKLQLRWEATSEEVDNIKQIVGLLRQGYHRLGESDQQKLRLFFEQRLATARDDRHEIEGEESFVAAAFDYRRWFTFNLYVEQNGRSEKLTAKKHGVGSGGEQAVMLHLPLFAAAAALYSNSADGSAPRLVLLDEALAGIDQGMQERVMQVLVRMDMDWVFTQFEMIPDHACLPHADIYTLTRYADLFGVHARHEVWNGQQLTEEQELTLV